MTTYAELLLANRGLARVDKEGAYCPNCGQYNMAFGTTSNGTFNSICKACGYDWLRDYYVPEVLNVKDVRK